MSNGVLARLGGCSTQSTLTCRGVGHAQPRPGAPAGCAWLTAATVRCRGPPRSASRRDDHYRGIGGQFLVRKPAIGADGDRDARRRSERGPRGYWRRGLLPYLTGAGGGPVGEWRSGLRPASHRGARHTRPADDHRPRPGPIGFLEKPRRARSPTSASEAAGTGASAASAKSSLRHRGGGRRLRRHRDGAPASDGHPEVEVLKSAPGFGFNQRTCVGVLGRQYEIDMVVIMECRAGGLRRHTFTSGTLGPHLGFHASLRPRR